MVAYFIPVSVSGWHPFDAIAALRAEGHGQATKAALKLMTSGPQVIKFAKCGCFLKWWYPQIIHFIGFSIINHPFWGTHIFGETPMY